MKTSNHKSGNNTISKFYLFMVLATSIGFAQTEKPTSDLSSASTKNNPYYKNNAIQGEMVSLNRNNSDSVEISSQRATKPNGQDNENPFSQKGSVSNVLKTKHDTAKNSVGNIR